MFLPYPMGFSDLPPQPIGVGEQAVSERLHGALLPPGIKTTTNPFTELPKAFICRVAKIFLLAIFYNPCMKNINERNYIKQKWRGRGEERGVY